MKQCQCESEVDWHRLSTIEFASALEVYWIADRFDKQPDMQRVILEHALDEYRHAELFKRMAEIERAHKNQSIQMHGLIEWGGISRENQSVTNLTQTTVSFLLGEQRAEASLNGLMKRVKKADDRAILESVLQDEQRHTSGIERYLNKQNPLEVLVYKLWLQLVYRFKRINLNTHLEKFRGHASRWVIKLLLQFPIEKLADLPLVKQQSLRKSLEQAGRMS